MNPENERSSYLLKKRICSEDLEGLDLKHSPQHPTLNEERTQFRFVTRNLTYK